MHACAHIIIISQMEIQNLKPHNILELVSECMMTMIEEKAFECKKSPHLLVGLTSHHHSRAVNNRQ